MKTEKLQYDKELDNLIAAYENGTLLELQMAAKKRALHRETISLTQNEQKRSLTESVLESELSDRDV